MPRFNSSPERIPEVTSARPCLVVIDSQQLRLGCVVKILELEFQDFDVFGATDMLSVTPITSTDVRLVILNIEGSSLDDPAVQADLGAVRQRFPDCPIALMSRRDDDQAMIEAVERGVRGYLPTSLSLEIVVAALRVVLVGGLYFPLPQRVRERQDSPERTPLQRMVGQNEADRIDLGAVQAVIPKLDVEATPSGFTPREAQVLAALRRGQSNKVIASDLNLSENTVKVHVRHIMRKLHATNRTQAVLYSQRRDL